MGERGRQQISTEALRVVCCTVNILALPPGRDKSLNTGVSPVTFVLKLVL